MRIVRVAGVGGQNPTYAFGAIGAASKYFEVDWPALIKHVEKWLATNEDAKAAASPTTSAGRKMAAAATSGNDKKAEAANNAPALKASYVKVGELGRYCILSRAQGLADDKAEAYFAGNRDNATWLSLLLQEKLSLALAEELDRALPKEFFRIAAAGSAGATTATTAAAVDSKDTKSSDDAPAYLTDNLLRVSNDFLATLANREVSKPRSSLQDYLAKAYPALKAHLTCRAGGTDDGLPASILVTTPLIKNAAPVSQYSRTIVKQKQNDVWCIWVPTRIALVYQPAKFSGTAILFDPSGQPYSEPLPDPYDQPLYFVDPKAFVWAAIYTLPEPGTGLGKARADAVKEMHYRWTGRRSLGYALGLDMSARRDSLAGERAVTHASAGSTEAEKWFPAFLPRYRRGVVDVGGDWPRAMPRTAVAGPASMDNEIFYYKKADIQNLAKKNYPTATRPFERSFPCGTKEGNEAEGPMLVASTFARWFKRPELLAVKTIKRKNPGRAGNGEKDQPLIPAYNKNKRKAAAPVMLKHIRQLAEGTPLATAFQGTGFTGSATEVTTAFFNHFIAPGTAATAATAAADTAATAADTVAASDDSAAVRASKRVKADSKSASSGAAQTGRAGSGGAAVLTAAAYWFERSNLLRTSLGDDASAAQKADIRTDQEWCHLLGHGDGGEEKPENFVAGSKHCNTEQLAVEEGHRITRGTLEVRITAYLLPQHGQWLRATGDEKMQKTRVDRLERGRELFQKSSSGLADEKSNNEATVQALDKFFAEDILPAIESPLARAHVKAKLEKKTAQEKLRYLQDGLEALDADLYVYFPVAAFIRYKIYYGEKKILDHVFDAQKESFDFNEFEIVRTTVMRAVSMALKASPPTASVAPPTTAAARPFVDYEDEINWAIWTRLSDEVLDIIYRDPGLQADVVQTLFDCAVDGIANADSKATGKTAVESLTAKIHRGYTHLQQSKAKWNVGDEYLSQKYLSLKLADLLLIKPFALIEPKETAGRRPKRKAPRDDTAAAGTSATTPAATTTATTATATAMETRE